MGFEQNNKDMSQDILFVNARSDSSSNAGYHANAGAYA